MRMFQRQSRANLLLFSATLNDNVEAIFRESMADAVKIQVGGKNHVLNSVQQSLSYCSNEYGKIYEIKSMAWLLNARPHQRRPVQAARAHLPPVQGQGRPAARPDPRAQDARPAQDRLHPRGRPSAIHF